MSYTANNIKIQQEARHPWEAAIALGEKYRVSPDGWLLRALEAAQLAGVPFSYIEDKYLKKLPLPKNPTVDLISRDIQKEKT